MVANESKDGEEGEPEDLESRLGPEIDEALLALDELALEDPEEALATFDTLPEPVQALVDFQLLVARVHQSLEQLEAARDILLALLPEHEQNPDVHHQLGDVLEDLGDDVGADQHFERVLSLDRDAFDQFPADVLELAREDVTAALARLDPALTPRSLETRVEALPSPEAVRSGMDPRALCHLSPNERKWTVFLANLAFEYGDIESDGERVLAMVEGLVAAVSDELNLTEAELDELGL